MCIDHVPTSAERFLKRFNEIDSFIRYNSWWLDTSNQFRYAVGGISKGHVVKVDIDPGQELKSVSRTNRKMIFVGTPFGPIVLFERYSNGMGGLIVANAAPNIVSLKIISTHNLTPNEVKNLLGNTSLDNFGYKLMQALEVVR